MSDIPSQYSALYAELDSYVSTFASRVNASWDGSRSPVTVMAAQLSTANSNQGQQLVSDRHYQGLLLELDGLKALGVGAIVVIAGFPTLHRPFYPDDATYQAYVAFYQRVANDIRVRGMKLILQHTVMLPASAQVHTNPQPFYKTLTWDMYRAARADCAANISSLLMPDHMIVINEPDTEARATGQQNVNTADGATQLLLSILSAAQYPDIAAGVGTWHPRFADFIDAFVETDIATVDMHVFNPNRGWLDRCYAIADVAAQHGKQVSISGTWLFKQADAELNNPGILGAVSARDPFDFWAPLDTRFLQALGSFAFSKRLMFFAPFFSQYLRKYLPFDTNSMLSAVQINQAELKAEVEAVQAGLYSETGIAYYRLVTGRNDIPLPNIQPNPLIQPPANVRIAPITTTPFTADVTVQWDPVPGAHGYIVFNGDSPQENALKQVGAMAANAASYRITTGLTGKTMWFGVKALGVAGLASVMSSVVSANIPSRR